MAAMPREVKVKTLEGGDLTVKVLPTNTIRELKAMLLEKKHCEDPIERQILKVKVLVDTLLVDDDQTLESAGLLHGESEVTVIYSRNEVEATGKFRAKGPVQLNIPSSLREIPAGAFEDQLQVVKVVIPESVTVIGMGAFAGCGSLQRITIPQSVTVIGADAFLGCHSLASITLPESVTAIREEAFRMCVSLASISIPESVTDIEDRAFEDCGSLTSITLPKSVTAIGALAFFRCTSLSSIAIPESVMSIRNRTFEDCKSLASITMPATVKSIGFRAFANCVSLASITIPESVTDIGESAFQGCYSLESILIPKSTCIGPGAFAGTGLSKIKRRKVWLTLIVCCTYWNLLFHFFSEVWISFHAPMQSTWPTLIISNLRGNEKSDEIAMTENPGRWFGIRENPAPFFLPHPKKVDFGQKLGEISGPLMPTDLPRNFRPYGIKNQLLWFVDKAAISRPNFFVCWRKWGWQLKQTTK